MEAYSNAPYAHTPTRHLTKLYSDAKKSALTSLEVPNTATQQFSALHRKYRIQKDRLITWGLAWSDDEKHADGNIDESVAKAGLTETVDSVLRNIKEVTDEAERIKAASAPAPVGFVKGGDSKVGLGLPFDEARYEDLLRDLTASIDTLYDLSRSRKALARGEHPTFRSRTPPEFAPGLVDVEKGGSLGKSSSISKKGVFRVPSYASHAPSYASSERTLVNPQPFHRPSLSPYDGLPPRIEINALRLPEEGPPPYEALGVPSTTRLVGHLVRNRAPEFVQNATGSSAAEVPVLVEFANFDTTYHDTGVPPPLRRLEILAAYFQPMRPESQTNLSLLGYFEDYTQPRIGLVYDLPYSIQNKLQGTAVSDAQSLAPMSLLKLVQKASKTNQEAVPPLEDRFAIAKRLTEQLHALHGREVAHGNINSNSIIFTTTENETASVKQKQIRSPLLASFDLFSKCNLEGITKQVNLNIYKHPEDDPQIPGREVATDIKFDMYGLATILLEIGLWMPIGDLYKAKYSLEDFKLRLEKLWIPKLAAKCGTSYMRAVEACVAACDDLDLHRSMAVVESAYDFILRQLHRCCLLDDEGPVDLSPPHDPSPVPPTKSASSSSKDFKRKPVPSDAPALSRQQSAPYDLPQEQSFSSTSLTGAHRLQSLQDFAMADFHAEYAQLSPVKENSPPRETPVMTPSPLATRTSIPEPQGRVSPRIETRFDTTPSLQDFKRKVTIIQRQWRKHAAYARQARASAARAHARSLKLDTEFRPEQRVKPKRQEFPGLDLPPSIIEDWHNKTSFQLAKLVEKALKGSPESSSISLTAYGETPETARPTFLVCCTSTAKVKHVLKRHFKYDSGICDVRVKKDEIRRCRRARREPSSARRSMAPVDDGAIFGRAVNPDYQVKPLCGASIGAFRDEEHLPPVSFGGVVLVDGAAYGMSVHHMLEANDDDDEFTQDSDADDNSESSSLHSLDEEGDESDSEVLSEPDDESTVRPSSTVPDLVSSEDTDSHFGDSAGIKPTDFEEIPITQPALDDAIDLDLHVDEDEDDDEDSGIDEDHLLSYKLGQIHASSGLKRTATSLEGGFRSISQSLPQEIDWALFDLVPPRASPYNVVRGGSKYCPSTAARSARGDTFPIAIKRTSELACAKVHCLGRTSGLAGGVISSNMELVKIHGRSTFSASWTVDGEFGVGGDSGAWVISNDDGRVCGHVVASRKGRTYICPMELLLEDIKATLGAGSVKLPCPAGLAAGVRREREGVRAPSAGYRGSSGQGRREEEQYVAEKVGRLRIGGERREGAEGSGGVALPSTSRPGSARGMQFAARRYQGHGVSAAGVMV